MNHPKSSDNQVRERIKTNHRSRELVETPVGKTRCGIPVIRVGRTVIGSRQSEQTT